MPNIVDLDLPVDKLDDLMRELQEKFRLVVTARANQIDNKAVNWQKNYDAIPAQAVRTVPFARASNFMPHLIRMHSDILGARVLGILFGTKPFWVIKSLMKDMLGHDVLENIGDGLNYLWENDLYGFDVSDQIVNDTLQTGTLTVKAIWSDQTVSYMGKTGGFDERRDQQMQYEPIPFEDFWPFPITAPTTTAAEICFHRIRLTERDVQARGKDGRWDANAASLLVKSSSVEAIREAQALSSGISLTADVDYPYSAIECWLNWEVGGKMRPIVVLMNPKVEGAKGLLRAFYNFMPYGEKAFIDFRAMRRKGSYFGYSVPEILEQSQEEQAQIHNGRRDANTIANIPSFLKKRFADVPNPATDWYPGCVIEVDEMDDLAPIAMGTNYNSMMDEEQFVMSLAERYIGISPSMQGFGAGQSAGKRGIYSTGATLALLSEGNKRQDIYIRRFRYPFHRVGRMTALCYNQFAPTFFADKFGAKGKQIQNAFSTIDPRNGALLYDPSASEASSNREIDRQSLLQVANVLAGYYERIVEAAGTVRQLQEGDPLRATILMVLDGARDLASRLLFAFDIGDRQRILPDIRAAVGGGTGEAQAGGPGVLPGAPGAVQQPELENVLRGIAQASGGARQ